MIELRMFDYIPVIWIEAQNMMNEPDHASWRGSFARDRAVLIITLPRQRWSNDARLSRN
jgi:hypothetical protein